MDKKRRIGIVGGTFDPIHYGHLLIAENACEQFGLDCCYFVPTGNSPHKSNDSISDAEDRIAMIQETINDNSKFSLSRIEVDDPEVSYTYRTLEKMQNIYKDADLFFILGGDSIAYLKDWKHPELICKYASIVVAARDEVEADSLKKYAEEIESIYHTRVYIINAPSFDVSSHEIRHRVHEKCSIKYMTPDCVISYIRDHHLYE